MMHTLQAEEFHELGKGKTLWPIVGLGGLVLVQSGLMDYQNLTLGSHSVLPSKQTVVIYL